MDATPFKNLAEAQDHLGTLGILALADGPGPWQAAAECIGRTIATLEAWDAKITRFRAVVVEASCEKPVWEEYHRSQWPNRGRWSDCGQCKTCKAHVEANVG